MKPTFALKTGYDTKDVALGYISAGEAVPGTITSGKNHCDEIYQNVSERLNFSLLEQDTVDTSYSYFYLPSYINLSYIFYLTYTCNLFAFTPYALFEEGEYSSKIILPYKYELRFDHLARDKSPDESIALYDQNGAEIPKQYYMIQALDSQHMAGIVDVENQFGEFVISRSQIDSAKARACQGKNIWGDDWGTSDLDERRQWELDHPESERPPIGSGAVPANETLGYWNRLDDGRYTSDEFDAFYVSQTGYWGQTVDGSHHVQYQPKAGGTIDRGLIIGSPNSYNISRITSYKFLSGDDYTTVKPYRIVLLLPEFLCFQDGITIWVEYNKYVEYYPKIGGEESATLTKYFIPNYREIINPEPLMKVQIDYTMTIENDRAKVYFELPEYCDVDIYGVIPGIHTVNFISADKLQR